ncbi:MAG: HU family DNA-binding protein [Solirubrobacteraceae bacterium]
MPPLHAPPYEPSSTTQGASAHGDPEQERQLIARHLADGDEVNVPGFGKFTVTDRAARQGRNPQTGETIQIAASQTPKFSPAGALKTALKAA